MINSYWVIINGGAIYYPASKYDVKFLAGSKNPRFIVYTQPIFNFGFGLIHKNLIPYLNKYSSVDKTYYEDFSLLAKENKFFNFRLNKNTVESRIKNLSYLPDGVYAEENSRTHNVVKIADLPDFKAKPYNTQDKIIKQLENLVNENNLLKKELDNIYNTLSNLFNTLATTPLTGNGAVGYPTLTNNISQIKKNQLDFSTKYSNIIDINTQLLKKFQNE